ncbi:hypothetical protein BZA70DRAFT_281004 [Myxozyma melibiosi]|uniref:Secreted protein n=1 Tax=Myxozyma melibiosi TaxID=54550 RepID=A0ABR1F3X3_9ASCO
MVSAFSLFLVLSCVQLFELSQLKQSTMLLGCELHRICDRVKVEGSLDVRLEFKICWPSCESVNSRYKRAQTG